MNETYLMNLLRRNLLVIFTRIFHTMFIEWQRYKFDCNRLEENEKQRIWYWNARTFFKIFSDKFRDRCINSRVLSVWDQVSGQNSKGTVYHSQEKNEKWMAPLERCNTVACATQNIVIKCTEIIKIGEEKDLDGCNWTY